MKIARGISGSVRACWRFSSLALRSINGRGRRAPIFTRKLLSLKSADGGALVEMALTLPLFLMIMTAIFSIGSAFGRQIMLIQAVGTGGQYLQQIRTSTTDPCADTFTAIKNSAPYLDPASISLTVKMNGTTPTQSGNSCAGAQSSLLMQTAVTVSATYPCNIGVYGVTIFSNCQLQAQVTEYEY